MQLLKKNELESLGIRFLFQGDQPTNNNTSEQEVCFKQQSHMRDLLCSITEGEMMYQDFPSGLSARQTELVGELFFKLKEYFALGSGFDSHEYINFEYELKCSMEELDANDLKVFTCIHNQQKALENGEVSFTPTSLVLVTSTNDPRILTKDGAGIIRGLVDIEHVPSLTKDLREFRMVLSKVEAGVKKIELDIHQVASNQYELRKENEELRQLNKDGYFNFAVRVKGDDFLAFAVIMALGNRKAAADHLKIPHRTFYDRVNQWAKRGKDYQLMVRYMEWRKRSSRHLKVELNPSLQSGESGDQAENPETMADVLTELDAAANSQDYPALLADLLQALERQNAGNWKSVREELITIIKEDLPQ